MIDESLDHPCTHGSRRTMPIYGTPGSYAVETVDNIDEARLRLVGKLVDTYEED